MILSRSPCSVCNLFVHGFAGLVQPAYDAICFSTSTLWASRFWSTASFVDSSLNAFSIVFCCDCEKPYASNTSFLSFWASDGDDANKAASSSRLFKSPSSISPILHFVHAGIDSALQVRLVGQIRTVHGMLAQATMQLLRAGLPVLHTFSEPTPAGQEVPRRVGVTITVVLSTVTRYSKPGEQFCVSRLISSTG